MTSDSIASRNAKRRGFSLIEIMVVVLILGILATAVVSSVVGQTDSAKVARAKSDIATYMTNLDLFRMDMDRYPSSDEGLRVLKVRPEDDEEGKWKGKYVQKLSKDPWGRPYIYICPGEINEDEYDLLSYGRDGVEGGEKFDADILHWTDDFMEEDESEDR